MSETLKHRKLMSIKNSFDLKKEKVVFNLWRLLDCKIDEYVGVRRVKHSNNYLTELVSLSKTLMDANIIL